jgi:hypothetical protein
MRTTPRIVALSFTVVSLVVASACGGSESDRDEPKIKNVAISNTSVNAGPTSSYATGLNKSPMPTSALPMIPQTTAPANNQSVVNMGPTTSYATGLNKSPMPTSALPMIPQTTVVQKATPTSVFTATTAPTAPVIDKNVVNMGPTTTEELAKPASSNSTVAPKVTTKPKSTTTTVAKKTTKKKKKPTK